MKKDMMERKFKCPHDERPGKQYTMNCYYFGCIHQINNDCPLKRNDELTKSSTKTSFQHRNEEVDKCAYWKTKYNDCKRELDLLKDTNAFYNGRR